MQDQRQADPGVTRPRVDLERTFKSLPSLLQGCRRSGSVEPAPSAHDEVTRIGIESLSLLTPTGFGGDKFQIECSREADSYFGLRICQCAGVGIESLRPKMRAAFSTD